MHSEKRLSSPDPLYGRIALEDELVELRDLPIVQRLRHIRLSNIDSVDLPGISNLSRYEHVLGSCHLASKMPLLKKIPQDTALLIKAAALLHDWGISPFGHLVEEAAQYLSIDLEHEAKLAQQQDPERMDIGGAEQQLLYGRETGLTKWLSRHFGANWHSKEEQLMLLIQGQSRYGRCIAGTVDVDNLDNVTRIAFHMGLKVRRSLPEEIASRIVDVNEAGEVVFSRAALPLLEQWVELRRDVYGHLMLAPSDFVGKIMLIASTYRAFEEQSLEWKMTDVGFVSALLGSKVRDVRETAERWMVGDLWDASTIWWMDGEAPPFRVMKKLGEHATDELGRPFYAYRIKDKRNRSHSIKLEDGSTEQLGVKPSQWVLGFASPTRKMVSTEENRRLMEVASRLLETRPKGIATLESTEPTLFDV